MKGKCADESPIGLQGGLPEQVRGHGPIRLTVRGALAERIRDLCQQSDSARVQNWCYEALEYMVMEHRAGKYVPDPDRHTVRNGDDFSHVIDEDVFDCNG